MPVFLIGMLLLLAGAIVYVGLRAIRWLRTMFDFKRTYILWVVLVLLPLLFVFGDMLSASAFARAVTITGGVAIGVFLYILLFTVAADLIALLLRLTPISRKPAFRRCVLSDVSFLRWVYVFRLTASSTPQRWTGRRMTFR